MKKSIGYVVKIPVKRIAVVKELPKMLCIQHLRGFTTNLKRIIATYYASINKLKTAIYPHPQKLILKMRVKLLATVYKNISLLQDL